MVTPPETVCVAWRWGRGWEGSAHRPADVAWRVALQWLLDWSHSWLSPKNNTYKSQLPMNTLKPRGMPGREVSTLSASPQPARNTRTQQWHWDPAVAHSEFGSLRFQHRRGDTTNAGNINCNDISSNGNCVGVTSAEGRVVSNNFQVLLWCLPQVQPDNLLIKDDFAYMANQGFTLSILRSFCIRWSTYSFFPPVQCPTT